LAIAFYWVLFDFSRWYFIASELILLITLALSFGLYNQLIRPISLMKTGTNALKNKDFTVKYVKSGSEEVDELIEVYNTMIDTLRIEQTKTAEQSYFLEKLIQASPIGIVILDFDGNISDINPMASSILDIPLSENGSLISSHNHPLIPQILDLDDGQAKLLTQNGFEKYRCQVDRIIHKGFPRKFIILADLTAEILESEKEAYGKVIRMMAHEVNNSMGAINSIINTVAEYGFDHEGADQELKSSLHLAVDRNKSLAKFIDNFADIIRLPKPRMSIHDLNALITNTAKSWEGKAKDQNITFSYKLSPGELNLNIDSTQIERVISNALKNAIESIENNGEVIIQSQSNPIGFSIIDNGPGISDSDKEQIFTPFFSTKVNGQGIGLMLCREILDNHGGTLDLYTKGDETHFKVELPIHSPT
jgi:nitrogen fixation/metabolism regulation signal transduction histidine kinase